MFDCGVVDAAPACSQQQHPCRNLSFVHCARPFFTRAKWAALVPPLLGVLFFFVSECSCARRGKTVAATTTTTAPAADAADGEDDKKRR